MKHKQQEIKSWCTFLAITIGLVLLLIISFVSFSLWSQVWCIFLCVDLYSLMKRFYKLVFILASSLSFCKVVLLTPLSYYLLIILIHRWMKRKYFETTTLGKLWEGDFCKKKKKTTSLDLLKSGEQISRKELACKPLVSIFSHVSPKSMSLMHRWASPASPGTEQRLEFCCKCSPSFLFFLALLNWEDLEGLFSLVSCVNGAYKISLSVYLS